MNKVKEILQRNEYIFSLMSTDGGCVLTLPPNMILDIPYQRVHYQSYEDGIMIFIYDNDGNELSHTNIECPTYAKRMVIMYAILGVCALAQYKVEYIEYVYQDEILGDEDWTTQLLSSEMDDETLQKENTLRHVLNNAILSGFPTQYEHLAKSEDVIEGYMVVKQMFQSIQDNNDEETQDIMDG